MTDLEKYDQEKDIEAIVDTKVAIADDVPFVIDPEVEKRLMRKVDLHLMPAVWFMLL